MGKSGLGYTLRCVSRESDAMSPHIVGFKFHFVKYFYPASRRERMLQRRRAHPNKALRKLCAPRDTRVCMGAYVCVCVCVCVYVQQVPLPFSQTRKREMSAHLFACTTKFRTARRSIALGYALLILYFVKIPYVVAFVGGFIT